MRREEKQQEEEYIHDRQWMNQRLFYLTEHSKLMKPACNARLSNQNQSDHA